jgi:arylsulfatase A-like enzyme
LHPGATPWRSPFPARERSKSAFSAGRQRWPALLLPLAFALLAACGDRAPQRPNVLLVSIDTLRADHLSSYGYRRPTSPNLDRLAAEGTLFLECFAPTSWTLPSHLSLLTGLGISVHGIDDDRLWQVVGQPGGPGELPLRGTFVPEVLARSGYRTAGFHSWMYLEERFGFGPGFEVYERIRDHEPLDDATMAQVEVEMEAGGGPLLRRLRRSHPQLFMNQGPVADRVVERGIAWLDGLEGPAAPWFLFLHIFDPHDDYTPPEPFDALFTDPDYDGPIDGRSIMSPGGPVQYGMEARDLEHLIALYDGEIAWVDEQLERLWQRLAERGEWDRTLVVITSDHGEEFFEHDLKQHRAQLYRESVHVPLILRLPGRVPAGARVAGPVGLIDVAPTLYALADVAAPQPMSGIDLMPLAFGRAPNGERPYTALLHHFEGTDWSPSRRLALRIGDRATLWDLPRGGPERVVHFDRAQNPMEVGPGEELAPADPRLARALADLDAARTRYRRDRDALPPAAWTHAP